MHKMTKACSISLKTKRIVAMRDEGRCVVCGSYWGLPNAHYIPRSHGGLGIPENIVTLCHICHRIYDNSERRQEYKGIIRRYLQSKYPDWDEEKLVYKKWDEIK